MFAKLKKKIHEEGGDILPVSAGPGLASPISRDKLVPSNRHHSSPQVLRKHKPLSPSSVSSSQNSLLLSEHDEVLQEVEDEKSVEESEIVSITSQNNDLDELHETNTINGIGNNPHTENLEDIITLQAQITMLKTSLESEKKQSQQKVARLELQVEDAFAKEIENGRMYKTLLHEKEALQDKLSEAEKRIEDLVNQLEGETTQSSDQIHTLKKDLVKAKLEISSGNRLLKKCQEELITSKNEKDSFMLRNAELSQHVERLNQQISSERKQSDDELNNKEMLLKAVQVDLDSLRLKVKELEEEKDFIEVHNQDNEELLKSKEHIANLESQVAEKAKANKMLHQRLSDLKKTLQRELKVQSLPNDPAVLELPSVSQAPKITNNNCHLPRNNHARPPAMYDRNSTNVNMEDDVNFKYLKHVVLKFMLSRETEAIHLVKAIATLLKFTADETHLIKDTLEWKTSWFKVRPLLGKGQLAKEIPASW